MARTKKENEEKVIYDFETKEFYLNEVLDSDESAPVYRNLLERIGVLEDEKKTEIYNMDKNQMEELFHGLQIRGVHSMSNALYFIKRYVLWAKKRGLAYNKEDLLPEKFDVTYINRFIFKEANKRYTRSEVLDAIKMIDDPRYAVAILCLFEGIRGQWAEELANLKMDDLTCDSEGVCRAVLTSDSAAQREIIISYELYKMLESLDNVKNVGTQELAARFALAKSPFIFKKVERKNASNDLKITNTFLTRTISAARIAFNNDKLRANDITTSGIAHYANELMSLSGERKITNEMLKLIGRKFNVGLIRKAEGITSDSMDEFYYSYGSIKKVIDASFVTRTYGKFEFEVIVAQNTPS